MMRKLAKEQIQEYFDRRKKLHEEEVNRLFDLGNRRLKPIQYRYLQKGIRYQGIYDIETSNFDPIQNHMVCYVFARRDVLTGKVTYHYDKIEKGDIRAAIREGNFDFDRDLLVGLSKMIKSVHHLVGHYSKKFDTAYYRSRCLLTGQPELIPDYGKLVQGDTWRYMKNTLKANRNSLDNLATITGVPNQKTHVDSKYWRHVGYPDSPLWKESMDYIMDHCIKDVKMSVRALQRIERFNPVSVTLT